VRAEDKLSATGILTTLWQCKHTFCAVLKNCGERSQNCCHCIPSRRIHLPGYENTTSKPLLPILLGMVPAIMAANR
jgi:hypothetical protein